MSKRVAVLFLVLVPTPDPLSGESDLPCTSIMLKSSYHLYEKTFGSSVLLTRMVGGRLQYGGGGIHSKNLTLFVFTAAVSPVHRVKIEASF